MAPSRPRQPHAQRKSGADRRREIADAALRVIAEHGLGRFTALAVAEQVGLTDAALFRHFASMEAIVLGAIDRVEELLFEGFPPEGADPLDRLGVFFRRRAGVIRANPGIARLFASEELSHAASPEGVRRLGAFRARSMGFVRDCVTEAAREGRLAPGLGAEESTLLVVGALLALSHSAAPGGGAEDLPERAWRALETLLRGPTARQPSAVRRPPRASGRPNAASTR